MQYISTVHAQKYACLIFAAVRWLDDDDDDDDDDDFFYFIAPLVKRSCALDLSNENYTWSPNGCKELNQLTLCYCKDMRCNGADRSGLCSLIIAMSLFLAYIFRRNY